MPSSIVPDSFSNLTQPVTSIDDRYDLAGFKKVFRLGDKIVAGDMPILCANTFLAHLLFGFLVRTPRPVVRRPFSDQVRDLETKHPPYSRRC
jgi:hypothetical protein